MKFIQGIWSRTNFHRPIVSANRWEIQEDQNFIRVHGFLDTHHNSKYSLGKKVLRMHSLIFQSFGPKRVLPLPHVPQNLNFLAAVTSQLRNSLSSAFTGSRRRSVYPLGVRVSWNDVSILFWKSVQNLRMHFGFSFSWMQFFHTRDQDFWLTCKITNNWE